MNCSVCNSPLKFDETFKKIYESFVFSDGKDNHSFPLPDICFTCTQQRLLLFPNERNLYKSKESFEGKDIISMYSPDKDVTVYEKGYWMTGKWDALDYGKECKEDSSFFEQFGEMRNKVPVIGLNIINCENCEFNNNLIGSKNAYMCFGNESLEDCSYVTGSFAKASLDVWWSTVENCYEIFNCGNMYKSYFCSNCAESRDLILCDSLFGCKDCIMCSNLINQQYHILNKKYTKEEYLKKKKELNLGNYTSLESLKKIFYDFLLSTPKIFSDTVQSENVKGNYIYQSKNCINCYNVVNVEDCSNFSDGGRVKNVANSTIVYTGEGRVISSTMVYESSFIAFSAIIAACKNITYSTDLYNCSYCFGCIGLKNKSYCVFNVQYSKQDYFEKVSKIIIAMKKSGEWGKIFTPDISLFGYNETLAHDEFPIGKSEAQKLGFQWSDYEPPFPEVTKTIPAEKLPDSIDDIPDDILNWALICTVSKKPFKITATELQFYRKHNLPIPRIHPTERHLKRLEMRSKRMLFDRTCDNCSTDIETPYYSERKEQVFCRKCYDAHVFG